MHLNEENAQDTPSVGQLAFSSVTVVFPAYNEESNVRAAGETAFAVFSKYFKDVEVIIVDDGSKDKTREILEQMAKENPNFHPVFHPQNMGYGQAINSGFVAAQKELIFFSDSDLQFDLNEIDKLLPYINEHDLVIGYRADRADPLHRKINAKCWNILVSILLGIRIRDIDCAFKIFRRDVVERINLQSKGAMINTELLASAQRLGMTIKEVPVSHFPRQHGQQTGASLKVILKAFKELFTLSKKIKQAYPTAH
jgi:glycosyltransferase involved in cell wall biosynthesis